MKRDLQIIARITLQILENKTWESLNINEVKKKSKVKLFSKKIYNKKNLIENINLYFDYCLSLNLNNIEKSNDRDMIFEIIMMRFDILQKHRKAVKSIFNSLKKKPHELILFLPNLLNSMIIMLGYTKKNKKSIARNLRAKGVLIIYILTFLIWLKDENQDLDKTMQALDDNLTKVDKILSFI